MKELLLKTDGMMCGACEAHVADAVRKAANVKSVKASHTSGKVDVICDDDISADAIVQAIQAEGYHVLDFEEKPFEKRGLFAKLKKH